MSQIKFVAIKYLQVTYTETIVEDIPPNRVILRINAHDADLGSNAEIQYSLHGTGSDKFFLEPESGKWTCKLKADFFFLV